MKLIILAAGIGSRTNGIFGDYPKCTAIVNGEPLIRRTVKVFKKNGISDITLVIGYQGQCIKSALKGLNVSFVFNPFFRATNSLGSLWFAKSKLRDDSIIMNADVYLDDQLIYKITHEISETSIFYDSSRIKDADFRFFVQDGILSKYGKQLSEAETSGEYVGVCFISKRDISVFVSEMNRLISLEMYNLWWENVVYNMNDNKAVLLFDCKGSSWGEIDDLKDYITLKKKIEK